MSSVVGNLKSNMDRFIADTTGVLKDCNFDLKSNMDRFIAYEFDREFSPFAAFKIQYG